MIGDDWVYPVIAPIRGDLQMLFQLARQYGAGFSELNSGCNNCCTPGAFLDMTELPKDMLLIPNHDKVISEAITTILHSTNRFKIAETKKGLKKLSVFPVPVSLILLLTTYHGIECLCSCSGV